MASYYECKRCFHKFSQKNDISRHLNRKKECNRALLSYQLYDDYDSEALTELSFIKIKNEKKDIYCDYCQKSFCNIKSLDKHLDGKCKSMLTTSIKKPTNDLIEEIKAAKILKESKISNNTPVASDLNITKDVENTIFKSNYIENLHQTNNNISDSNVTNIKDSNITNINLNINLINSFDEDWNTTHIDDKIKFILLCQNAKFTSTLEKILENEVNQNVLIDNNNLKGLVYKDKKLINMDIKDIVKNTMDKLFNQLSTFKKDIINNEQFSINHDIINEEMNIIDKKYEDFKLDKDNVSNKVNNCITDIYNKKRENTIQNFTMIVDKNEETEEEGY